MNNLLNKLPFANQGWFMYLRLLVQHFLGDACSQKASSLTYTTLLSVVPMITVLLVIFSSVPALSGVKEQIQNAIYSNLLPSSGVQVTQYLAEFTQKSSNVTAIGILMLFVTTIMTLITIETAFNQIWRVQDRTGGLKSIMRYWTMITLGPIILGVAFTASSAIQSVNFLNQKIGGYGIDWAIYAQIVSFLVTVAGFVGMYWFIPKVNVPIKNAVIAGVVIAVLFECVKRVFGFAITNFTSYQAIYGAFAALPIFLMWVYLSWNLILLGVEISYTLTIFETKEVPVRHPLLSLLDMLNKIYKNYQNGKSTSEQELRDTLGRKELPKWNLYLTQLAENDLIVKTENDEYTLKKDLNTISLWQLYKTLPYPLPIKDELDKLKQADYDPWFVELYSPLTDVENNAQKTLSVSLATLFTTAPLREKQAIVRLVDSEKSTDEKVASSADDTADMAGVADGVGDEILLPEGNASLTESKTTIWLRRLNGVRHWVGRGKKVAKDIKKGLE